jgi:hypothetical protein
MSKNPKDLETPATKYAAKAEEHLDLSDPEQKRLFELYLPEAIAPNQR